MNEYDEYNISVEEVMKIIHKDRMFIINAIQQGAFPGSVAVNKNGRRNVHIPRKAFWDYMNNSHKSPSDELIIALLNRLTEKQKVDSAKPTQN